MTPNKEKLQNIIDSINSNHFITINLPWKETPHKITLIEDEEECSLTLDLGYKVLKEIQDRPKIFNTERTYKNMYNSLIQHLFNGYLAKIESDFTNAKNKSSDGK